MSGFECRTDRFKLYERLFSGILSISQLLKELWSIAKSCNQRWVPICWRYLKQRSA